MLAPRTAHRCRLRDWRFTHRASLLQTLDSPPRRDRASSCWPPDLGRVDELGKVATMARSGQGRDTTADRPGDAARRWTGGSSFTETLRHVIPRRQPLVPSRQSRKWRCVRQRQRRGGEGDGDGQAGFDADQLAPPTALCRQGRISGHQLQECTCPGLASPALDSAHF